MSVITVQWVEQVETWVLFDPMEFCSAKIYGESGVDENSAMEIHVGEGENKQQNDKPYIVGSTFQLDQALVTCAQAGNDGCKNPTIWDSLVKVG